MEILGGSKMTKKAVEMTEEESKVNAFVDTLWNQYEQSLDWSRKLTESRDEAYLKAVKEVTSLNKQYRSSVANFYQQSKKTNGDIVKGVSSTILNRGEKGPEVAGQVQEVSARIEDLVLTPFKLTFNLLDRLDNNLVENSENLVNYAKVRRSGWQNVTNEYVKAARNNHKKLVGRFEDSLKVLVNSK